MLQINTAITRARKQIYCIGDIDLLHKAAVSKPQVRHDTLALRLCTLFGKECNIDDQFTVGTDGTNEEYDSDYEPDYD